MSYEDFLVERRKRMATVVRDALARLGTRAISQQ